jgi:hypothetical protein
MLPEDIWLMSLAALFAAIVIVTLFLLNYY